MKINATGQITLIERYTFDADCMNTPFSFIPINKSNGIYAVAYQLYSTSQGKVKTIKIGNNGHIFGVQDSYIFDNLFRCREPSMISSQWRHLCYYCIVTPLLLVPMDD